MSLPSEFKFKEKTVDKVFVAKEQKDSSFKIFSEKNNYMFTLDVGEVARSVGSGEWVILENDNVNHPNHYQGKTEVIDIIEQATTDLNGFHAYCLGNVIKYIMRHQKKGGMEDLKKASWYLNRVIGGEANE